MDGRDLQLYGCEVVEDRLTMIFVTRTNFASFYLRSLNLPQHCCGSHHLFIASQGGKKKNWLFCTVCVWQFNIALCHRLRAQQQQQNKKKQ